MPDENFNNSNASSENPINGPEIPSLFLGEYDHVVGIEQDEEALDEHTPFDPDEISLDTKFLTVESCIKRIIQKTMNLNPNFQRSVVWDAKRKSRLIESLMLRIPLPMFYVSSDVKANFTVVDGLQRFSTLRDFILGHKFLNTRDQMDIGNGFQLEGLEFWKEYDGATFKRLPIYLQNRILESQLSLTIINPKTPEKVKRNIFKRINTGGLPLSPQEIRNALYIGPVTELLSALSTSVLFKQATGNSIHGLRLEDHELILRFLAYLVRDYTTYRRTLPVDDWLSQTMQIINATIAEEQNEDDIRALSKLISENEVFAADVTFYNKIELVEKFDTAMFRNKLLFGDHAFRKSFGKKSRSPINKALFETWSVLLSSITEDEFYRLLNNADKFAVLYKFALDDPDMQRAISRDSMRHLEVKQRFEKFKEIITESQF